VLLILSDSSACWAAAKNGRLLLATGPAAFRSAGSPEQAVAKVPGKTKARALFDRLDQAKGYVEVSELVSAARVEKSALTQRS
jgi:hypothetical protein